jgi:hypothetical protein
MMRFTFRQSQDILQANSTPKNPNINHDYTKQWCIPYLLSTHRKPDDGVNLFDSKLLQHRVLSTTINVNQIFSS